MAAEFLRRWFGPSASITPEVQEALDELHRLADARPSLAEPARLFADLLPKLYAVPVSEAVPSLTRAQAAARLAEGVPLLRGERLPLDEWAFRRRWEEVCAAVQGQRSDVAGRELSEALRAGRLAPTEMLAAVLRGGPEEVFARADALGLDAALAGTVLRLALFPVLSHLSAALAPLRAGLAWERGYCPICGGGPLLGEFRGLEQTRFLRCGLCAAAWEFPRLACPFCGTLDHRQLGHLHVEGEEASCRAATCDACRGYVKMVAALAELPAPRLLSCDVCTLHLDLAAAERGYTRPA